MRGASVASCSRSCMEHLRDGPNLGDDTLVHAPRSQALELAGIHTMYDDPFLTRAPHKLRHTPTGVHFGPDLRHGPGPQGLNRRVDPVDDHGRSVEGSGRHSSDAIA